VSNLLKKIFFLKVNKENTKLKIIVYFVLSVLFLATGHFVVTQRSADSKIPWFQISPDGKQYIAMVKGEPAKAPFSQRVIVPFIASFIPTSPENALRTVTYFSLFIIYLLTFLILDSLKFRLIEIIITIYVIFCSTAQLLLYQNPHMNDAFGIMCMLFMLWSMMKRRPVPFGIFSVVGILARESVLFMLPSYVAIRKWLQFVLLAVISIASLVLLRVLIGGELAYEFQSISIIYFVKMYLSWGILWIPGIIGFVLCDIKFFLKIGTAAVFILGGAVISSLFAFDTIRMYTILMPVAVVFVAQYVSVLFKANKYLLFAFLLLLAVNVPLALPTIFLPGSSEGMKELDDFYVKLNCPILALHVIGFIFNMSVVLMLRHNFIISIKEKMEILKNIIKTNQ